MHNPTANQNLEAQRPVERMDLEHEYHAYFGTYEMDSEHAIVRHTLEGQVVPGQYPDVVERRYRFSGDLPCLEPLEGTKREVIWQRVAR
jgi:hypothetical protein